LVADLARERLGPTTQVPIASVIGGPR
jgi:hypothetical protein